MKATSSPKLRARSRWTDDPFAPRADYAFEPELAGPAPAFFAQTGLLNRGVQLIVIVGAPFLGGLIGAALGISANALLDEGPARVVSVEVLEAYEESHAFVFKQYYAEYKLADDPEGPENVRKLYTSPDYLPVLFEEGPFVAEVRPGHFGWEWIETVRPVDGE